MYRISVDTFPVEELSGTATCIVDYEMLNTFTVVGLGVTVSKEPRPTGWQVAATTPAKPRGEGEGARKHSISFGLHEFRETNRPAVVADVVP